MLICCSLDITVLHKERTPSPSDLRNRNLGNDIFVWRICSVLSYRNFQISYLRTKLQRTRSCQYICQSAVRTIVKGINIWAASDFICVRCRYYHVEWELIGIWWTWKWESRKKLCTYPIEGKTWGCVEVPRLYVFWQWTPETGWPKHTYFLFVSVFRRYPIAMSAGAVIILIVALRGFPHCL
jgi:hypothetical protein